MEIPHPIPYQGSKRGLAGAIISYLPQPIDRLIEPFAGSAAISLAAAYSGKAERFVINDANSPLIDLWEVIIHRPQDISEKYQRLWEEQQGQERKYYDDVRRDFNQTKRPELLLYLLARCVKASVRYNSQGEFNQSPDNRRRGAHPATMRDHIFRASYLLQNKTVLKQGDYRSTLSCAEPADIVYMDPPYQGVCGRRNPRYSDTLEYGTFVTELHRLNQRSISYLLSYDGRTGEKRFGQELPDYLHLKQIEINAGRSSQATLLGRADETYEALYLSPALVSRLNEIPTVMSRRVSTQFSLFALNYD